MVKVLLIGLLIVCALTGCAVHTAPVNDVPCQGEDCVDVAEPEVSQWPAWALLTGLAAVFLLSL